MLQNFKDKSSPEQGPPRLAALRKVMAVSGIDAWLTPRADVHQGEYVAAADERLAWLTGFTGSAGFCIATSDQAGVFVDGRYRTQAKNQIHPDHFAQIDWPDVRAANWLTTALPDGGVLGIDPKLHTVSEIEHLRNALSDSGISIRKHGNLIDQIWSDRPAPSLQIITTFPDNFSGKSHLEKRQELAQVLRDADHNCAIITLPDSLCWLLNIRGTDAPRTPIVHGFAILHDTARVDFFITPEKLNDELRTHLGNEVTLYVPDSFAAALKNLDGQVRIDPDSASLWVAEQIKAGSGQVVHGSDPCILPKACKTVAEQHATRTAHIRDGAALCRFLAWYDRQSPGSISEIDVVRKLEQCRRDTGQLRDISFDTIAGAGPNGALPHYRVSESSNRVLQDGDLLVLDGGGQYPDGTTDVTRTLPMGSPNNAQCTAYTRVLQGHIAIDRVRFPRGISGRDLDVLARYPLWLADQDYNHGTGHGVGVYLSVHEGPQRLSRASEVPLQPGMILSNEPGYYHEGAFGIRIENLIIVQEATPLPGADVTGKLCFETLSFVPIDTRLIKIEMLTTAERDWLNTYHQKCLELIGPELDPETLAWLERVTMPL